MNGKDNIQKEKFESVNLTVHMYIDNTANACGIILNGSMDTQPVLEIRDKVKNTISGRKYNYVVNMNQVNNISSTGLGFLIFLAARKKRVVYVSSPHKAIAKPLKILGIQPMFKFYKSISDLEKNQEIPDTLISWLQDQVEDSKQTFRYHERWVNMLREYLANIASVEEVQNMMPYIEKADTAKSITLPSDEKYNCILYRFLERVFRKVGQFDVKEIDEVSLEIVAKELMANAVIHGYEYKKDGVIEASYKLSEKTLEISVIDYGKGFNKNKSKPFPSAGLKLLKTIFDDLSISSAPKKKVKGLVLGKGTMVKMIKHLVPQSS